MRKVLMLSLCCLALLAAPAFAAETIKMSTTTSTQDSGLLEVLLPQFTKDTGIEVQVIAKGTGAAIRDGEDGNVDVIFVHDPAREEKFVAQGFGTKRYAVMHNDFVVVGPASDPAKIKGGKDAGAALAAIAKAEKPFISRGDESGTHAKERALWKVSGVALDSTEKTATKDGKEVKTTTVAPKGAWYMSIGQGMGKTLLMAEEKQGYALADRGTFIQQKFGKTPPTTLEIMVEGDKELFNYYGVIPVNPAKHPHTKIKLAEKFADWLVSPKGQKLIADYKLQGKQLFFPDAMK